MDQILSKKGALAKIWLAAHWEKKLSKTQFMQTNISNSVGAIINVGNAPMALRLTGQLLLGVVRIYSRKARYLLEDCNEALLKIKMAFKPCAVNLSEDHAINLNTHLPLLETLLPEPTLDLEGILANLPDLSQNVSRFQDITMKDTTMHDSSLFNTRAGFDIEEENGLDGILGEIEDGWQLDLGVEVARDASRYRMDSDIGGGVSIEVGRDAQIVEPFLLDMSMRKEDSLAKFDGAADFTFDAMDQETGFGNDEMLFDQILDRDATPVASHVAVPNEMLFSEATPVKTLRQTVSRPKTTAALKRKLVDAKIELHSSQITRQLADCDDILLDNVVYCALTEDKQRTRDLRTVESFEGLVAMNRQHIPKIYWSLFASDVAGLEKDMKRQKFAKAETFDQRVEAVNYNEQSFVDVGETGFGNEETGFGDDANQTNISMIHPFEQADEMDLPNISAIDYMVHEKDHTHQHSLYDIEEIEEDQVAHQSNTTVVLADALMAVASLSKAPLSKQSLKTITLLEDKFKDGQSVAFTDVTEGVTRADACRFFFEVLVLKSRGMIKVQQDVGFGEILVRAEDTFYSVAA